MYKKIHEVMSQQTCEIQQSFKINDSTVLGLKVVWSATVHTIGASIMNILYKKRIKYTFTVPKFWKTKDGI